MQKRGVVDKGFFLTVVLILGAVLVVSFLKQGTTGQYYASGDDVSASLGCAAYTQCGRTDKIFGLSSSSTESGAIKEALESCEKKKSEQVTAVDTCISEATLACLKKSCDPTPFLTAGLTPCKITKCNHHIYGRGRHIICIYEYDENGKKQEPGECMEFELERTDSQLEWYQCWADDGNYYGGVTCNPKPKKLD